MCPPRRRFLRQAVLAVFSAAPLTALLSGCARRTVADGPQEIRWDRDVCAGCGMVISDRRFASQLRNDARDANAKFDDIGCAVTWLAKQPWGEDPATRLWVADSLQASAPRWLDARRARYLRARTSPMGYGFAAVAEGEADSIDFTALREFALKRKG
jgi:nitrous oxide reductase accessory protein NosL